jgi:hypothetical protein
VAIDPRRLKPGEAARLLNSTPLGEVVSERQLHRHRTRAGFRIAAEGDTGRLDLLRYVAWLAVERHALKDVEAPEGLSGYEAAKERSRIRHEILSQSGRDIGELPEVADPQRKEAAGGAFRLFCETYFPAVFHLGWSPDHLKVIAKIELSVLHGGLFAMAMPRGSGKTSLCETACLWAMLYGHRRFVALIGSDEEHASRMLDSIRSELEHNALLLEDFPEAVFPVRALEGIHQRAAGQLYRGRPTLIGWTARELVLPTIPGARSSGAVIQVAGLMGRIRGMKHKRPDGSSVRPSLVLIDDPQNDESARSNSQTANRERVLAGAVLGLAGPVDKISGLMTLTVVRQEDLADRILDRAKHPHWNGERTKMVYAFPKNEKLWARYAEIRATSLKNELGLGPATDFYREHREKMDAGAQVAWAERFNPDEISALQHAMNLKLQDEHAFYAEYQNEPLPEERAEEDIVTAGQVAAKLNGLPRGRVPISCTRLTMFIDVQGKALFYLVAAWEDNCTGYVLDYGTEPDQKSGYFSLRDARKTLAAAAPGAGPEAAIYAGLERLVDRLVGQAWQRDDGAEVRIDRCLIDANWGASTDVVYQFCRQTPHASIVMPSHGRYVGASSRPLAEYDQKPGERVGLNWRVPVVSGKRAVRHVVFDTNYWKTFVHSRLAVPIGDPGALSIFGRNAAHHRLLSEHLTSEYRVRTEGRGRTVDEWKLRAGGQDNHFLDCLVGAAVGATMEGCAPPGVQPVPRPAPRRKISFAALAAERRITRLQSSEFSDGDWR